MGNNVWTCMYVDYKGAKQGLKIQQQQQFRRYIDCEVARHKIKSI